MPYELKWYIKDAVIYQRSYGEVTMQETTEMGDIIREMMRNTGREVHLISDSSEATKTPRDLSQLKSLTKIDPEIQAGWVISVSPSAAAAVTLRFISLLMNLKMVHMVTVDKAIVYLHKQDSTLAELQTEFELV